MRSFSVTMKAPVIGTPIASGFAKRGSTAGRALSRSGVGVRMISTAAGVFLAFLTVGHTQSNTRALSSAEPPRLQSSVERLPVAADHTRQNRQTARLSDPGVVQSRHVDLELHQLYDEIMRRVDMSYKDAR